MRQLAAAFILLFALVGVGGLLLWIGRGNSASNVPLPPENSGNVGGGGSASGVGNNGGGVGGGTGGGGGRKAPAPSPLAIVPPPAATTRNVSEEDRRNYLLKLWSHSRNMEVAATPLQRTQAGSMVPVDAAVDHSAQLATLVSVHGNGTIHDMLEQIAEQAKLRIGADHPGIFHNKLQVHLDLDHQPVLEAINEVCSQAGLKISAEEMALIDPPVDSAASQPFDAPVDPRSFPRLVLGQNISNRGMGPWAVSGAFSYEVTQIEHEVPIGVQGSGSDVVTVSLEPHWEPKLHVLSGPGNYSLDEAVDENGNDLALSPGVQRPFTPPGQTAFFIGYPTSHPGHRIAKLRGRDHLVIVRKSQHVELAIPQSGAPTSQPVGDMVIKADYDNNTNNAVYFFNITLERGDASDHIWANLRKALTGLKPRLETTDGGMIEPIFQPNLQSTDDGVTFEQQWWKREGNRTEMPLKKIVIDVPTDVYRVEVPVEFDNLPLP